MYRVHDLVFVFFRSPCAVRASVVVGSLFILPAAKGQETDIRGRRRKRRDPQGSEIGDDEGRENLSPSPGVPPPNIGSPPRPRNNRPSVVAKETHKLGKDIFVGTNGSL